MYSRTKTLKYFVNFFLVSCQISLPGKRFVTNIAYLRLDPIMNGHDVSLQVRWAQVGFCTLVAGVFSLPAVGLSHVSLKLILNVELFVALFALNLAFAVHGGGMSFEAHG